MERPSTYRKSLDRETRSAARDGGHFPFASILERIAFYGLLAVIFLSAIPYGTVLPFHKSLLIVSVCVIAVIRIILGVTGRSIRFSEPVIFLPLAGILLLAILQTVPFPFLDGRPVSRDPYETKIFIVTFAALLIAGELLFFFTNSRQRLQALISLVLVTSAACALFGILRDLVLNDPPGVVASYYPGESFGPFINRNHFAVLIEMALGLTVGLLLKGRWPEKFKFFGWVLSALFIYAMISANSRGGLFSLAALAVFAGFVQVMTKRKKARSWTREEESQLPSRRIWRKAVLATALSYLILGIFIFTVAFVGGDTVVRRIERIQGEIQITEEPQLNRVGIWQITGQMIKERPLLGFGFGGYAAAFPAFDDSGGKWNVQQAHNDYLEVLANGGLVAFVLFGIFAVIVVRRALRNFKSDDPLVRSSCFGALIGMFGVMIHNVVDFGLHMMVNALIFVSLVVISTVRIPRATASEAG